MEEVGQAAADMKLVGAEPAHPTFLPRDASLMCACPDGCVRGKVYFDTNALHAWLKSRGKPATIEALRRILVCSICGERPAELRVITRLHTFRLCALPGMPEGGR